MLLARQRQVAREYNELLARLFDGTQLRSKLLALANKCRKPAGGGRSQIVNSRADTAEELVQAVDRVLDGHIARDLDNGLLERDAEARASPDRVKIALVDAADLAEVVKPDFQKAFTGHNTVEDVVAE